MHCIIWESWTHSLYFSWGAVRVIVHQMLVPPLTDGATEITVRCATPPSELVLCCTGVHPTGKQTTRIASSTGVHMKVGHRIPCRTTTLPMWGPLAISGAEWPSFLDRWPRLLRALVAYYRIIPINVQIRIQKETNDLPIHYWNTKNQLQDRCMKHLNQSSFASVQEKWFQDASD